MYKFSIESHCCKAWLDKVQAQPSFSYKVKSGWIKIPYIEPLQPLIKFNPFSLFENLNQAVVQRQGNSSGTLAFQE